MLGLDYKFYKHLKNWAPVLITYVVPDNGWMKGGQTVDIVQIKYGYICCLSIVHMFGIRTSPMPTLYPPIIWAYPYFICPLSVHAHLISARHLYIQGSPKECFPGLVNFVTAVAYHFCLNLSRAFSQPGQHSFGDPCTVYRESDHR